VVRCSSDSRTVIASAQNFAVGPTAEPNGLTSLDERAEDFTFRQRSEARLCKLDFVSFFELTCQSSKLRWVARRVPPLRPQSAMRAVSTRGSVCASSTVALSITIHIAAD
jgi:hypothetical protein